MVAQAPSEQLLNPEARDFYRWAMNLLKKKDVPFMIGGAYALAHYTGIVRHTKDFDIFLREGDCPRALEALAESGYHTELTFPHWLAKAFFGDHFLDFIFSSGNGVVAVDEGWFEHAVPAHVLDRAVYLIPAEEMIWSKAFILERERFDGADICHLIRALGPRLDWSRLLDRFHHHWRVLFGHLVLYGFSYPGEQAAIPGWVIDELSERVVHEMHVPPPDQRICGGTLLSRGQYLVDIDQWGYRDARIVERTMESVDIDHWTAAIGQQR